MSTNPYTNTAIETFALCSYFSNLAQKRGYTGEEIELMLAEMLLSWESLRTQTEFVSPLLQGDY